MTSKISTFSKLHQNLTAYVKEQTATHIPAIPSIAEFMLFLTAAIQRGITDINQLETDYKQHISRFNDANDEVKNKIKRYIQAMIDLLVSE